MKAFGVFSLLVSGLVSETKALVERNRLPLTSLQHTVVEMQAAKPHNPCAVTLHRLVSVRCQHLRVLTTCKVFT